MHRFFAWFGLPGKLVLTALISLTAIVLAVIDPTPTRIICIPAMLLSSLGDIILMNYKPITKHLPVKGFIAGCWSRRIRRGACHIFCGVPLFGQGQIF